MVLGTTFITFEMFYFDISYFQYASVISSDMLNDCQVRIELNFLPFPLQRKYTCCTEFFKNKPIKK